MSIRLSGSFMLVMATASNCGIATRASPRPAPPRATANSEVPPVRLHMREPTGMPARAMPRPLTVVVVRSPLERTTGGALGHGFLAEGELARQLRLGQEEGGLLLVPLDAGHHDLLLLGRRRDVDQEDEDVEDRRGRQTDAEVAARRQDRQGIAWRAHRCFLSMVRRRRSQNSIIRVVTWALPSCPWAMTSAKASTACCHSLSCW